MTEGHAPAKAKSLPSPECPAISLVPLASGSLGQTVQICPSCRILGPTPRIQVGPVPVQSHLGQFALSGHSPLQTPPAQPPAPLQVVGTLCCHPPHTLGSNHSSCRLPFPQFCQHLISAVSSQGSSLPCLDHSRRLWFPPSPSLLSLFSDLLQQHIPP